MNSSQKTPSENNKNQKGPKNKGLTQKIQKNEECKMIEEINFSKLSEKEFYERIKPWIEDASENFGRVILECLKIVVQKNFLAYQLFKILASSKIKVKLKSITGDTEKSFYTYFWQILQQQKDTVKIEGLKLLGFLTSENLQNISQQTQIDSLNCLKKLSNIKLYPDNIGIIRYSFNGIGNILTNSNFKFIDENHEIFYNVFELLKDLNSLQKLEDSNNIKTLAVALRVLGCLYVDLKVFPSNIGEFVISQLIKYVYFGTSFFPLPNTIFPAQSGTSSDSQRATSSSEISDMEDPVERERKKEDESCAKIRNYSAVCLANIFRQNSKLIPQYFSTLLPCKILRKEVLKFITTCKGPLGLSELEFPEKRSKRAKHLLEFRNDFNEPTLLNLLLFEENNKVKLSIYKTVSTILDGYSGDKLLLAIDGEKLEKTKIEPYKSISHQIYQIFKNVTLAVTISILVETDETLLNHLLRLASTMLAHPSYDKVGHLTIQIFLGNILPKILPQYMNHTIYLSCIACFSSLAGGNIKHKAFEKLALTDNFNVVGILIHAIKDSLNMVLISKDVKTQKTEKVSDSTILMESIIALSKFPKYYVEHILEYSDLIIHFLQKAQGLDKKYTNIIFKLVEEILKYLNNSKDEGDQAEIEIEIAKKEETTIDPATRIQIQNFHIHLSKFLKGIFNGTNENTEHILDILYYLEEKDWESYYMDVRDQFIETFLKINSQASVKQSFLRLLGKMCIFSSFIKLEKFPNLVYGVISNNSNEKNSNTVVKNSWVLANLCANLKSFDIFSVEENQDLFLISLGYCSSTKEKLISNGFRALGYYISNNSDEMLCKTLLLNNAKAENIKKELNDIYRRPFSKYSVKVCWNICVSLSNIFRTFKPNFMQIIFSEDILYNVAEILTTKNNFKTQIHCIETLALAHTKFPHSLCFTSLMKTLISIYFAPDEGDFDVSELRYLPHLKGEISKLLLKLLKNFDFEKNSKDICDILVSIPHGLSRILYEVLEKSYKDHKDKLVEEKWKEDEENQSPTIKEKDNLINFDEVMVKGLVTHKEITIPTNILHNQELQDFKNCLEELQYISQKIAVLIDSSDELSVPFSVYNSLKQLADIELNSKEKHITLDLNHI